MSVKVAVSGYYGFGNFGDEAILSVLVSKLKENGAEITVFSSNPQITAYAHKVNSVNTFDYTSVAKTLAQSDILISGGGSLLQDATSIKSLCYYLMVIAGALLFKKKVIIFAQGIGPIKNKAAVLFTKMLLSKCAYVSVRDEKSLELLKTWNVPAHLLCDPIYSISAVNSNKHHAVGIQLREFNTVSDEFLQNLADVVVKNFSDYKIELFSLQKTLDYEICKRFEQLLKRNSSHIQTEIIETNLIQKLSDLDYLISMRFHALLVAVKAGVKCCAVNYDPKIEKFAQEASIPLIELNENKLQDKITDMKMLDEQALQAYSSSKCFDWSTIISEISTVQR